MPQAYDEFIPADANESESKHRLHQQALAWKKRSRKIARLRLVFPGLIVLLIIGLIAWIIIQSIINSMNVYNATGDEIRMTNPLYMDRSEKGDRYELRGVEAVRRGRNSQTIQLTAPRLEIRSENTRPSYLEAAAGVYNDRDRSFTVNKDVLVRSGSGFTLRTQAANVDLQQSVVTGQAPVQATWTNGSVSAQGLRIQDNGKRVFFYGKGNTQVTGTISNTSDGE